MARAAAILKALGTAFRRDWKTVGSIGVNAFFPVTVLMLGQAGGFLYLILGLVVLFPASTDPLRKIPASRLGLWPLEPRDRLVLRLASPWLNPVTWLLAGMAVWAMRGRVTIGLWAAAAGLVVLGFLLSDAGPAGKRIFWRRIPAPAGPLGQLIRKNVREVLSTLDFYVALLLSLTGLAYRLAGLKLPPEAYRDLALLVVLAMCTFTQSLFGLDGGGGMARYRLLPLRGWQVLAAKDAAFLGTLLILLLPLDPVSGLAGALAALALGHSASVNQPREQSRWRFSGGVSLPYSIAQVVAMAAVWGAVANTSRWFAVPAAAIWMISLVWYGLRWDQRFLLVL
jgi:hypothetical protein